MSDTITRSPASVPRAAAGGRVRRIIVVLPIVLLCALAILRVLDAVPSILRGEPRSVRTYPSIEALERDTRTQLFLPFYFPDTLAWPPRAVYRAAGHGTPTSVEIADRDRGDTRLIIAQCLEGACRIPDRLLPPGEAVQQRPVQIGDATGLLTTRRSPAHGRWIDLAWTQDGRQLTVRLYGEEPPDLLRIGRSFRRGHP